MLPVVRLASPNASFANAKGCFLARQRAIAIVLRCLERPHPRHCKLSQDPRLEDCSPASWLAHVLSPFRALSFARPCSSSLLSTFGLLPACWRAHREEHAPSKGQLSWREAMSSMEATSSSTSCLSQVLFKGISACAANLFAFQLKCP